MTKRIINAVGRTLGKVFLGVNTRNIHEHRASNDGEDGPIRTYPPRWRLMVERDYDRTEEHTTWILEAVHCHDQRAVRIKDFRWHNTLKQTHRALKIIEDHAWPAGIGLYLTARQIAELYRHNGAEHGPAVATVEIANPDAPQSPETRPPDGERTGGLKYQIHVNKADAESFQEVMDDVYTPSDPPTETLRRWGVDEINPRHPRWLLWRQPLEEIEQWTLTAVHKPTETKREVRIKEIRWETRNVSNRKKRATTEPESEYSASAIADLIERNTDPERPVRVQLLVRETTWEREPATLNADSIKELFDTIYDPES